MAKKHRGGKAKHAPGFVSYAKQKVSPAQVRAKEAKAKEISAGKKKRQDQASAVRLAEKEAKRERQLSSSRRPY